MSLWQNGMVSYVNRKNAPLTSVGDKIHHLHARSLVYESGYPGEEIVPLELLYAAPISEQGSLEVVTRSVRINTDKIITLFT